MHAPSVGGGGGGGGGSSTGTTRHEAPLPWLSFTAAAPAKGTSPGGAGYPNTPTSHRGRAPVSGSSLLNCWMVTYRAMAVQGSDNPPGGMGPYACPHRGLWLSTAPPPDDASGPATMPARITTERVARRDGPSSSLRGHSVTVHTCRMPPRSMVTQGKASGAVTMAVELTSTHAVAPSVSFAAAPPELAHAVAERARLASLLTAGKVGTTEYGAHADVDPDANADTSALDSARSYTVTTADGAAEMGTRCPMYVAAVLAFHTSTAGGGGAASGLHPASAPCKARLMVPPVNRSATATHTPMGEGTTHVAVAAPYTSDTGA